MKCKHLNKKGFTLIEIIVVVVIMAVLLAVAVPSVLKYISLAREPVALTECKAVVTASQKEVLNLFKQGDELVLDQESIESILTFANVSGSIQGDITLNNTEVIKLLYQTSDHVYVQFDTAHEPHYYIFDADQVNALPTTKLNTMLSTYIELTKQIASNSNNNYIGREKVIEALASSGLEKVDSQLIEAAGYDEDKNKDNLYWRPYYLGTANNPQMILYAGVGNISEGSTNVQAAWNAKLIYVNGQIYSCNTGISNYSAYKTSSALLEKIESEPEIYTRIN